MIKQIGTVIISFVISACSQQNGPASIDSKTTDSKQFNEFYYSKNFANRFEIKSGTIIPEWNGLVAVALESKDQHNPDLCYAKLYLGKDINFDYPQPANFINITGERHKELFSFMLNLSDEDAQMQTKINIQAANKIAVRGYIGDKITASTGFSIDYIIKDAIKDITIIKTDNTLCDVLLNNEYKYYMLLKPKGIDKSEKYLKYSLPINK